MLKYGKIKVGKKYIEALLFKLGAKNLIIFKGSLGYIMCGYLNLRAADKLNDAAVRIVGVSNVSQARKAKVHSLSRAARKLGVFKGQAVEEALEIIA